MAFKPALLRPNLGIRTAVPFTRQTWSYASMSFPGSIYYVCVLWASDLNAMRGVAFTLFELLHSSLHYYVPN
eukprot:scaffold217582_cov17-Prasinocladus_malaysianus.AAC.1